MTRIFLLSFLLLASCASSPDKILSDQDKKEDLTATKKCLDDPEQSKAWGECNVKKVVFDHLPQIKACYDAEEDQEYDFEGDLILEIRVKASGRVRKVEVREASLKSRMLSGCLVKEIAKLKFAKPPAGIRPVIFFPFSLEMVAKKK